MGGKQVSPFPSRVMLDLTDIYSGWIMEQVFLRQKYVDFDIPE